MKLKNILLYAILVLTLFSCKKDIGNYEYTSISEPTVVNLQDATFRATVGDTLTVRPYIDFPGGDAMKDLLFNWEILVTEETRSDKYEGYPLKIVYNLAPGLRSAKLTVTNTKTAMKYFISFKIQGGTQFSLGKTVMSVENGITKLSFIKPDNKTVLADLYKSLNGEDLPQNAVQLFGRPSPYQPTVSEDYWAISSDPTQKSVIIDGNTMLRKRYFPEHFFNPPATMIPERFESAKGFATGIINGKLYIAVTSTAPFAPDYGKFSNPQAGDYTLSKFYSNTPQFYFGFDKKSTGFVSFNSGGDYSGANYTVTGDAFDPKKIGMTDLIYMKAVPGTSYAFFKDAAGALYELSFGIDMNDYINKKLITPKYKRLFRGASLIQPDTKWQKSLADVFYFTSGDKIYRYNPLNEEIKALDANFGGKKVTMLQLSADDETITAGVEGAVFTLDVSTGLNGVITSIVNGIPGSPIDIVIKK